MEDKNLPVMVCSQPPVISSNLRDWHAQIAAVEDAVANAPKDREGLAKVKELRAELRKQFDKMEAQRKAVKAAILAPYDRANEAYKKQVAEPMRITDEVCKRFVDDVSDRMKARCLDELKGYFAELVVQANLPWLTFDRCGVKIDMATTQKKDFAKERQQICSFVQRISSEMRTLSTMEDSKELLGYYIKTLDVAQAVAMCQQHKREQQAVERLLDQEQEKIRQEESHIQAMTDAVPEAAPLIQQEKIFTVTFTVHGTIPMLRGLKAWLDNNHYQWEEN